VRRPTGETRGARLGSHLLAGRGRRPAADLPTGTEDRRETERARPVLILPTARGKKGLVYREIATVIVAAEGGRAPEHPGW